LRALVIAPQPFFAYRGTPFSVYYRTLVTAELGVQCDLLTYGQGMDVHMPGCRIYRIPAFRWLGDVRVGPSVLKAFLDMFMVVWTIALLCRRRYDLVHAHEEAVFWCRCLKPLFRFRLIYDMHSSLPEQLDNFHFVRLPLLRRLFRRWERKALLRADAVITVCPALLSAAIAGGADAGRTSLIENSIVDPIEVQIDDATRRAGAARAEKARRWVEGRGGANTIIYAGTLEAYQGIDRLLEGFAHVARTAPAASLLIVGGQPRQVEAFGELAAKLGIADRICFTGWLKRSETRELYQLCAAAVSPRATGKNTPMKIYELIARGVPLVATRIESHTQVLNDEVCTLTGVAPEEFGAGMLWALTNPGPAREKAARAVDWYGQHYSRRSYTEKLQRVLSLASG
jgi:glycosyltransferase involved in cell wall biosynthesis